MSDHRKLVMAHLEGAKQGITALAEHAGHLARWGETLAIRLPEGKRLLIAGNGGSAAEAQHFSAELVGRYRNDRPPFSAIALHAESSSVTAIGNDYGFEDVFCRQIQAHARPGDIALFLSTSGTSRNLILAAEVATTLGVSTWTLCGKMPNPLAEVCDEAIGIDAPSPHIQECHLIAIHTISEVFDARIRNE